MYESSEPERHADSCGVRARSTQQKTRDTLEGFQNEHLKERDEKEWHLSRFCFFGRSKLVTFEPKTGHRPHFDDTLEGTRRDPRTYVKMN